MASHGGLRSSLSGVCYKISLLQTRVDNIAVVKVSVACATKSLSYSYICLNPPDSLSQWRVLQNLSLTIFETEYCFDESLSGVCYKISLLPEDKKPDATGGGLSGVCYKISLLHGVAIIRTKVIVSVACATKSLSYSIAASMDMWQQSQWRVLQNLSLTR